MSASLNIYVDYLSQPARSVGILCKVISCPHNEHLIELMKREHETSKFLSINPFGKIPAVKDGNTNINESCSALRYIASKYDKSGQWYPADLDTRVKIDEYLDWQHANTRGHGTQFFFQKMLAPKFYNKPMDVALVNEHREAFGRVQKDIVDYFLASKPFIAGTHATIADIAATTELEQVAAGGYDLCQPIKDYMERVKDAVGRTLYEQITKKLHDGLKYVEKVDRL